MLLAMLQYPHEKNYVFNSQPSRPCRLGLTEYPQAQLGPVYAVKKSHLYRKFPV